MQYAELIGQVSVASATRGVVVKVHPEERKNLRRRPEPKSKPAYEYAGDTLASCASPGDVLSLPVNLSQRLARIEALLEDVLGQLRMRRRHACKRARTVRQNAYLSAANDNDNQPSELEIAAARRILHKRSHQR